MPFHLSARVPALLLHPGRKDAERVTAGTLRASAGRGLWRGEGSSAGSKAFVLHHAPAKRGMSNNYSSDAKQLSVPDGGVQVFSPKIQKLKVSRELEPRNSWFNPEVPLGAWFLQFSRNPFTRCISKIATTKVTPVPELLCVLSKG